MTTKTLTPEHLLNWHSIGPDGTAGPDGMDGAAGPDGKKAWNWCLRRALAYGGHRIPSNTTSASDKKIALVFFNDSLRTRASMELAAFQLGAYPLVVTPGSGTWGFAWNDEPMVGGEAEHIREAIGVLSRYSDALGVRLFASGTDLEMDRNESRFSAIMKASSVPVINLESAFWHPCQALADAAVITSHMAGETQERKFVLTWAPHPKALPTAVPNSTLLMAVRLGMHVTVARPDGFDLDETVMHAATAEAVKSGGSVSVTNDQAGACESADVVYAKSWGGLGRYENPEEEADERRSHASWCVDESLMSHTNDAVFMHCLPVRRGVVVTDSVLDGPGSLHLDQAEYRVHAQKAILEWTWGLAESEPEAADVHKTSEMNG